MSNLPSASARYAIFLSLCSEMFPCSLLNRYLLFARLDTYFFPDVAQGRPVIDVLAECSYRTERSVEMTNRNALVMRSCNAPIVLYTLFLPKE